MPSTSRTLQNQSYINILCDNHFNVANTRVFTILQEFLIWNWSFTGRISSIVNHETFLYKKIKLRIFIYGIMASLFFAWKNILCPTTYLWDESKKQDFWINPVYLITVATSKQIFKKITFEFKEKQFLSMKWVRHCSCHLYSNSKEPNHCPNISKSTVFTTLNVNNFVYFYTWHCKKKP